MSDEVDPRFDPRFQRGYDPARHAAPKRPVEAEAEPGSIASETADAEAISDEIGTPEAEVETEVDVGEVPRRNLPLLVLPVIAAACFLAALGLLARLVSRAFDGGFIGSQGEGFLEFAQTALTGPLFVGGIVALAAWIIVGHVVGGRDDR